MLNSVNLEDKSYEELLAEAIGQISLHSAEWTNFNQSDPGITVLQNLTAFNHLQQEQINEFGEALQKRLLSLLGFTSGENKAAKVLVKLSAKQGLQLPKHSSFFVGNLQFELESEVNLKPWGLQAVIFEEQEKARDITYLLNNDIKGGVAVFGKKPAQGNKLLLFLESDPFEKEEAILWVEVENSGFRNSAGFEELPKLAQVQWQVFTQKGWLNVKVADETGAFLQSGMLRIKAPREKTAYYKACGEEGYAMRCVLEKAEYDIPPRIQNIEVNLFEMLQKRTCAAMFYASGMAKVPVRSMLAARGNLFVYCKEHSEGGYREYQKVTEELELHGRYFYVDEADEKNVNICFDKDKFGFAPQNKENAVLIICYDDTAVLHRTIGQVFGYEEQELEIDKISNIVPEEFCLLVGEDDENGERYFYTLKQNDETSADKLKYSLLAREGKIVINSPASGENCIVYLAACATSEGENSVIRKNNLFISDILPAAKAQIYNVSFSYGGESEKTAQQLKEGFTQALRTHATAVTAADYENLVQNVPGLCIHKVRAIVSKEANKVTIAVKPHSCEKYPRLSEIYIKEIRTYIEERRMITTQVNLMQPRYVPVDVQAVIVVKKYASNAKAEIEQLLQKELDFVSGERDFGETVYYHKLLQKLCELTCVDNIYEFSLSVQNRANVTYNGLDIVMKYNCFCCPGEMLLELNLKN